MNMPSEVAAFLVGAILVLTFWIGNRIERELRQSKKYMENDNAQSDSDIKRRDG
jgi:hypothetical protein